MQRTSRIPLIKRGRCLRTSIGRFAPKTSTLQPRGSPKDYQISDYLILPYLIWASKQSSTKPLSRSIEAIVRFSQKPLKQRRLTKTIFLEPANTQFPIEYRTFLATTRGMMDSYRKMVLLISLLTNVHRIVNLIPLWRNCLREVFVPAGWQLSRRECKTHQNLSSYSMHLDREARMGRQSLHSFYWV